MKNMEIHNLVKIRLDDNYTAEVKITKVGLDFNDFEGRILHVFALPEKGEIQNDIRVGKVRRFNKTDVLNVN